MRPHVLAGSTVFNETLSSVEGLLEDVAACMQLGCSSVQVDRRIILLAGELCGGVRKPKFAPAFSPHVAWRGLHERRNGARVMDE